MTDEDAPSPTERYKALIADVFFILEGMPRDVPILSRTAMSLDLFNDIYRIHQVAQSISGTVVVKTYPTTRVASMLNSWASDCDDPVPVTRFAEYAELTFTAMHRIRKRTHRFERWLWKEQARCIVATLEAKYGPCPNPDTTN